jgi:tetratricopeptide (TPR) repeat protein
MAKPTIAQQCRQLIDKHQYKAALALLEEQPNAFTNKLEYYLLQSETYINLDKGELALNAAEKALAMAPNNARALWCRGNAYLRLKNYAEAIKDFQVAIAIAPNFAKPYNGLGNVYYDQKEYTKAIEQYELAIAKDPDHAAAYYNLGNVYYSQKDYANAIEQYELAIEKDPDDAAAYYNLGLVYRTQRNYNKAIEQYEFAIKKDPDDARFYNSLGNVYADQKEYPKAIELYNLAIQKEPDYALAYYNLGFYYYGQKEYPKAIEQYNLAIAKDPDDPYTYNNLGNVYKAQRQYIKAIDNYTKAIAKDSEHFLYFRNRGDAYRAIQNYDKAIADYDRALALNPEDYWVSQRRNEALALQGKYQAIKMEPEGKEKSSVPEFIKALIEEKLQAETEQTKTQVMILGSKVATVVNDIRALAFTEAKEPVAHYTKLLVANIIVNKPADTSKLRYYNVAYMNDPEEGKVLLRMLADLGGNDFNKIATCFDAGKLREDNHVYLGSFVPVSHQDELVMWRTYGKENNVEASGCSMVIAPNFFDGENSHLQPDFGNSERKATGSASTDNREKEALYSVVYYNKKLGSEGIIAPKADEIREGLKNLTKALHNLVALIKEKDSKSELASVVNRVVFRTLSEIRYLFKSADYSFEKELRVIQYVNGESDRVQIDETGGLPHRLYIESGQPLKPSLQKIILGPKVANPDQWLYLEVKMKKEKFKLELEKSNVQFQ